MAMAAATTMRVLEGHVEHRLNLAPSITARKKQRTAVESAGGSANGKEEEPSSPLVEAGFYLVVTNPSASSANDNKDKYLLSVPLNLLKNVCDAARFNGKVRVSHYALIPLVPSSEHRKRKSASSCTTAALLEVQENGLELLSNPTRPEELHTEEFLTLERMCEEEAKEEEIEKAAKESKAIDKKKKRKRQRRYNLKGTVDSVSPVIFVHEPFALMELYDETSAHPYSCVIVFQGTASLACHDGIFPGDDICLKQVKRQRWKIPDEVLRRNAIHLKRRVPSHVFVIQDPKDVIWQCAKIPQQAVSTPVPLVSLQGKVVSREWASRGSSSDSKEASSYMIHAIEIEPAQPRNVDSASNDIAAARRILFLTYYPMSPSLTLSLRSGAMVHAINIHCIGSSFGDYKPDQNINGSSTVGRRPVHYYGACLRSTVTILKMPPLPSNTDSPCCRESRPPSVSTDKSEKKEQAEENLESLHKYYPSKPYALLTVQRSYLEYACRKEVYRWYYTKENFQRSKKSELPAFDALSKLWWSHRPCPNIEAGPSKRNPYLEFFDHACDDSENMPADDVSTKSPPLQIPRSEGCHCSHTKSTNDGTQNTLLPCWISLHEIQDRGIRIMRERLTEALECQPEQGKSPIKKPHVGWTASIDLTGSHLLGDVRDVESTDSPALFTGGKLAPSAQAPHPGEQCLVSVSLANDCCLLPANTIMDTPVQGTSPSSSSQGDAATFAFGQLDGVVVSCFCVKNMSRAKAGVQNLSDLQSNGQNRNVSKGMDSRKWCYLPRHDDFEGSQSNVLSRGSLRGACFLWETGELLFVVSVQLRFKILVPISPEAPKTANGCVGASQVTAKTSNSGKPNQPHYFAVQHCLDPEASTPSQRNEKDKILVIGALTRQRLRLSKVANNRYRGCVLTLSHLPINLAPSAKTYDHQAISTLQCIEVKTELHYTNLDKKRSFLKEKLANQNISALEGVDDAINLVLAWWKIADHVDSCALTSCGWDDFLPRPRSNEIPGTPKIAPTGWAVIVQLSRAAAQRTEARGYHRFSCPLSQLRARFLRMCFDQETETSIAARHPSQRDSNAAPSTLFDFIGGFKFLPGRLDHRPLRRIQKADVAYLVASNRLKSRSALAKGEQMTLPHTSLSGIPECSLADLLRCVCLDLQRQQTSSPKQSYIAPSLVRKVAGARLLGISFCQVQITCTRCFQAFRQQSPKEKQMDGRSRPKESTQRSWKDYQKQPSFWHCPLPIPGTGRAATFATELRKKSATRDTCASSVPPSARDRSTLCCPNGCDVNACAEVKWECSGTLDDGTGQAKLYTEREAAVMLLGMNQETVDWIEEGAWMQHSGSIVFSRNIPPPSHLAKAVDAANFRYVAQEKDCRLRRRLKGCRGQKPPGKCGAEIPNTSRVLHMMEPVDRAFYLLFQHCRHSKEATRQMDYLVRCKPLADNILHLNHTEIEVCAPGAREGTLSSHYAATYSLPPLKLVLVDACVATASSSGASLVEGTWDLIESVRRGGN